MSVNVKTLLRRIGAMVMIAVMLIGIIPVTASAAEVNEAIVLGNEAIYVKKGENVENIDFSNISLILADGSIIQSTGLSVDTAALTTAATGTYNLPIKYNGTEYGSVPVVVTEDVATTYPEYPADGAVRVNKTADAQDLKDTGVVKVELDAAGISVNKGVDVVLIVDVSNSMAWDMEWFKKPAAGKSYVDTEKIGKGTFLTRESREELYGVEAGAAIDKLDIAMDSATAFADILLKNNGADLKKNNTVSFVTFAGNDYEYGGITQSVKKGTESTTTLEDGSVLKVSNEAVIMDSVQTVFYAEQDAEKASNSFQNTYFYKAVAGADTNDGAYGTMDRDAEKARIDNVNYFLQIADTDGNVLLEEGKTEGKNKGLNRGGTNYDFAFAEAEKATEQMQNSITSQLSAESYEDTGRQTVVVFMTDGAPSAYNEYYSGGKTFDYIPKSIDSTNYFKNVNTLQNPNTNKAYTLLEYVNDYTNKFAIELNRYANAGFYNVGFDLSHSNSSLTNYDAVAALLGGLVSKDADKQLPVENCTDAESLHDFYTSLATALQLAGTEAVMTDVIHEDFTLQTKDFGGKKPTIDVYLHDLDANGDRTGTKTLVEQVTFADNGTKAYSNLIGETKDILTTLGNGMSVIQGKYFTYIKDTQGVEKFVWNIGNITNKEISLSFYEYLKGSFDSAECAPGMYPTNASAVLEYVDINGNMAQKPIASPVVNWGGATTAYEFYLVNEEGQPVNSSGVVISFANRTTVHGPEYMELDLNEDYTINAKTIKAEDVLPEGYILYDPDASYTIQASSGERLEGELTIHEPKSEGLAEKTTKIVSFDPYNYTQSHVAFGVMYSSSIKVSKDALGEADGKDTVYKFTATWNSGSEEFSLKDGEDKLVENIPAGAEVTVEEEAVTGLKTYYKVDNTKAEGNTAKVTTAKDVVKEVKFYNVGKYTEADTVVIDYGLPVDISVLGNDYFPDGVTPTSVSGELKFGTASVNGEKIRYSLNTPEKTGATSGMQMSEQETFQYNVQHDNGVKNKTYSENITVIPATSIYFEDNFVTYKTFDWQKNEIASQWIEDSKGTSATTQEEDRPGTVLGGIDANNLYGFDAAYSNCSQYSNGSAKKVTVEPQKTENGVTTGTYATAEFTFTGTGFDIVSLTSNKTGTIVAKVEQEQADGTFKTVKSKIVDTYYGYKYVPHKVTYEYINGEWIEKEAVEALELGKNDSVPTNPKEEQTYIAYENRWVVDKESNDSLYQIPVLKVDGLDYGTYKVTLNVSHKGLFDHGQNNGASYDFYLDAIRIYDPANDGVGNVVITDAYTADKEGWPEYFELRNKLLNAADITNSDAELNGVVFIDGKGNISNVADYKNYGPNNEVYLTKGQAITFTLNADAKTGYVVDKVQLAYKLAQGNPKIKIYGIADGKVYDVNGEETTLADIVSVDVQTATDLYHDITALNGKTVVITNVGEGILSITNVKVTQFKEAEVIQPAGVFTMRCSSVLKVLNTLNGLNPETKQGLVKDDDGHIRYYEDGVAIYKGLVKDASGNYYYVNSTKKAVKNCTYGIGEKKANGLLPAGTYQFDNEGKMIDPPPTNREGLYRDKDGELRYYEKNVAVYKGLVQDDEGNYYYINSTKKAVRNCRYGIGTTKANGLLPAGTYQFDAEGKMIR